jgi:hypothetical protein
MAEAAKQRSTAALTERKALVKAAADVLFAFQGCKVRA